MGTGRPHTFFRHLLPQHHSQEPRFGLGFGERRCVETRSRCRSHRAMRGASDTGDRPRLLFHLSASCDAPAPLRQSES
jgi:hypothetical protein